MSENSTRQIAIPRTRVTAGQLTRQQQAVLIQNGLTRVYYATEPIVTGERLPSLGKITTQRKTMHELKFWQGARLMIGVSVILWGVIWVAIWGLYKLLQ